MANIFALICMYHLRNVAVFHQFAGLSYITFFQSIKMMSYTCTSYSCTKVKQRFLSLKNYILFAMDILKNTLNGAKLLAMNVYNFFSLMKHHI